MAKTGVKAGKQKEYGNVCKSFYLHKKLGFPLFPSSIIFFGFCYIRKCKRSENLIIPSAAGSLSSLAGFLGLLICMLSPCSKKKATDNDTSNLCVCLCVCGFWGGVGRGSWTNIDFIRIRCLFVAQTLYHKSNCNNTGSTALKMRGQGLEWRTSVSQKSPSPSLPSPT